MRFLLRGSATGTFRNWAEEISCESEPSGPYKLVIAFRSEGMDFVSETKAYGTLWCVARGDWEISDSVRTDLIAATQERPFTFVDDLDKATDSQLKVIRQEMQQFATRTTNYAAWQQNALSSIHPFGQFDFSWQDNHGDTHLVVWPDARQSERSLLEVLSVVESTVLTWWVEHDIAEPKGEPLPYNLLREANSLQIDHPRSALVILSSAAEIAVREFIARRVPDAGWLVESLQSPPTHRIVREYLPQLIKPAVHLPKSLVNELESMTQHRNIVAHRPATSMDKHRKLQKWLAADGLGKSIA